MHIVQKPHASPYINSQGGCHENSNDCNDINNKKTHSLCKETTRQHQEQEESEQQEEEGRVNNNKKNSTSVHPILTTSSPFTLDGPSVDTGDACNAHIYYYPTPFARKPVPPSRSSSSLSLSWCSSSWPFTAPP
ncbi:hypothetical protein LSM04_001981 [Trypanosoma melophagium]|uniref:uncharacterized protein n=1 Tax=Trypanosoma melophagium TaxID=715481 RepID=UPI00351A8F61|nr:hypothetical protein LSM04_001981 [Trypanosoma melophagium]